MPVNTEECRIVLLSPFDIHFSQTRIRTEFQDSHTVEETIPQIQVVPLGTKTGRSSTCAPPESAAAAEGAEPKATEGAAAAADATAEDAAKGAASAADATADDAAKGGDDELGLGEEAEDLSEAKRGKDFQMLLCPFPNIEVTKWRCKLREPDGSPKLDAAGLELYSHEERWFSFDNRRLYCLQKAAAAAYPAEVRCEVVEIPPTLARTRELRKFDTRTFGCSVLAGRRDDPSPASWSWRIAVGLPEEAQPEDGVAKNKSMRWRGQRKGPNSGGGRRRQESNEEEQGRGPELMRSALLFFLVYLGLRIVVSIFRQRFQNTGAASTPSAAMPGTDLGGGLP